MSLVGLCALCGAGHAVVLTSLSATRKRRWLYFRMPARVRGDAPVRQSHIHDSESRWDGNSETPPRLLSGLHRRVHRMLSKIRVPLLDGGERGLARVLHRIGEGGPHGHASRNIEEESTEIPGGVGSD